MTAEIWYDIGIFRTSGEIASMMHRSAIAMFGGTGKLLVQLRSRTSPDGHSYTFQVRILNEGMRNFDFNAAMHNIWLIMLDLKKAVPEYKFG